MGAAGPEVWVQGAQKGACTSFATGLAQFADCTVR